jgi:tetratricopeptide (TPR) repeat protein
MSIPVATNVDLADMPLAACVVMASQAQNAKDLDTALFVWGWVQHRFSDDPLGYSGSGTVLRQLNRLDDAETVLAEGLTKFPADEKIAVAYAWVAHHRSDWPEADRRWTEVRTKFPGCFDGYFGGGAILRSLRRFDDADHVYRAAFSRFPVAVSLLGDFAAVAQARGDLTEASRRWTVLRTLFPEQPQGYLREARALREAGHFSDAEVLLGEALQRFPGNSAALIDFAHVAQQRGFWFEALKRWEAVATEFPGLVDGHVGAAQALNEIGRFADAQSVLQPALRMFPDSVAVVSLNAWILHYRGDFPEALSRWVNLRERFPTQVVGYTGGSVTLVTVGNIAAATAVLEDASRLFPHDPHVAMALARIPQHVHDWEEAIRRWASVHERFPAVAAVKLGYADSLSKADKWDEAEQVFEAAVAQHGGTLEVIRSYAECATRRRDWTTAEARWRHVMDRFPEHAIGWVGLGDLLRNAGRFDEAETQLTAALHRFPGNIEPKRHLAALATSRRDWPVALRLWEELKRKYPRNPGVLRGIAQALWQARQDLGVTASEAGGGSASFEIPASLVQPDETGDDEAAALEKLLMKFESIGDTCEFGIVQRRFGAEPISLLRWASTPPDKLVVALDNRFAGVGEPEHTIIAASNGEYTTRDRRYHMFSHTFTPETAEPLEKFAAQTLRRLQFLRGKLIDDLSAGEKVFVYKSNHGLSDDEARALYAAIRRYGRQTALLCVRLEDGSHPRGTLEEVEERLFIGYIDRFSTVDINVGVWVELCRKTEALWEPVVEMRRAL